MHIIHIIRVRRTVLIYDTYDIYIYIYIYCFLIFTMRTKHTCLHRVVTCINV